MVDAPQSFTAARTPPVRDEYVREAHADKSFGVVEKPLTIWETLYNKGWLRKTFIILGRPTRAFSTMHCWYRR
jgi:hypothetical protein